MFAPETVAALAVARTRRRASMRPGHVCPGKTRAYLCMDLAIRFNEAGACLPRKDPDRRSSKLPL